VAATASLSNCPLCGRELLPTRIRAIDRLVTGDGPFTVAECRFCRFGLTVPQLRGEELERYYGAQYSDGFYERSGGDPSGLLERARGRFREYAARRRFGGPPFALPDREPGRVLDVGCGAGELLAHYAALGWQTFGIDPAESAVTATARRGASVHHGTLADQPWPAGSFELITFSHSLEHIPEPLDALRLALELLAPNGVIAITLPNWSCWQRRFLFGDRWFNLDLPRHLQHFSPRALAVAAGDLELDAISIGTSSMIISVAYSLHYLIAGSWTPGWKLWLSYALGAAVFPLIAAIDAVAGGDCCYALLGRRADAVQPLTASHAATL
jgi:SAM-dependent methyltransferase